MPSRSKIQPSTLQWGRLQAMATLRLLVDYRRDVNVPAVRIAEAMQVAPSVIYRLETAERDPRLSTLLRYAKVLGLDIEIVKAEERAA